MPLKLAGTIITYGAPSDVVPGHVCTGDLPSQRGPTAAALAGTNESDAAIRAAAPTRVVRRDL